MPDSDVLARIDIDRQLEAAGWAALEAETEGLLKEILVEVEA